MIPEEMRLKWVEFFIEMFQLSDIMFKRSVKLVNAVKLPTLVIFSDVSKEAYGTCCYVRWELNDGTYTSALLLSKSKIAPAKVVTIVCLELLAAVVSKRLRKTIEMECRYKFECVIHIMDSGIVRAMIQRDSYGFNTFTSTRIGEVQENSDPSDWFWVSRPGDLITRGKKPGNFGTGSRWQNGPKFLRLPIEQWPIRSDCFMDSLPGRVESTMNINVNKTHAIITVDRFRKYVNLIMVTARILSLRQKQTGYSLKRISDDTTIAKFNDAVNYWVTEEQKSILP